MSKPTHILIVEDQQADFELARRELSKAVEGCVFEQVQSREGFLDALKSFQPDVILSDYSMPSFDGMSALKLAKEHAPLTPFIIWTGSMSEDVAVECMRAGANNYILKENLKRLGPAVIHAVDEREQLLERIQAEQKLLESEKRFRSLIENSLDNISLLAADGTLLWENPAVNRTLGYEHDEFVERNIFELMHPEDKQWTSSQFAQVVRESGSQQRGIFRLRHRDGTWRWIEATVTNMLNEPSVGAVVINYRDITERKLAEEKYQDIFENSREGIFQSTPEGRYINVNPAMAQIYGYGSPQEMIEGITSIAEQIYLEAGDRDEFIRSMQTDDHIDKFERRNVRKDGRIIWTSTSARAVRNSGGGIQYYEGFSQDVTERKLAEEALRENEERYRGLAENFPNGSVTIYNQDLRVTFVSGLELSNSGYSKDQFIGKHFKELAPVETWNKAKPYLEKAFTGLVQTYEATYFDNRHYYVSIAPLHNAAGFVDEILVISQNITDRKQAEIEIQQRSDDLQLINAINKAVIRGEDLDGVVNLLSKELKRIFSISGSTIYMLSPDGNSLMMQQYNLAPETTRRIEKVIGSTIPLVHIPIQEGGFFQKALMSQTGMVTSDPEQIMKWMEEFVETSFIPSIARGTIRKLIPQIFKFLDITSTITVPLILEGKAIGLLDVSSTEMFTENDLKRIENISRQLTAAIQRQQSIAQVQRSQAFLQSIQNALSASIAILNENGEVVQVNSAWRKFGEQNGLRHPEYCIGLNYLDICDSAAGANAGEAQLAAKGIREVITGQKREVEIEYPCHSPEEKRWFILRITKFDDGEHIWVVLAHENITARKQAEEAFRETSEQFRTLFEASPDAIMLIEPRDEWHIIGCNNAACQMNGYTRDELIGQSIGMLNLSPGSPAERSKYLEKIRASNILRYEDKHRRKDGTIFPIEVSTSLITVGGREMVLGIDRDITERKQAEAALRDSEEKYRLLFESNPLPMWIYDLETLRFLKVNEAAVNHYGYSEDEFMAMTIKDIRPATDIPRLLENISHIDQGIDNAGLWNHNKKDGSIIQVEIISHLVEFNGRRAELVLANDATERIQTQTKISELLAFNEKLLNNSPVGILAYKQTGECIFANQTAASIVGSDIERLRAQNYHELESWKTSGLYDLAENAMKTGDALVSDVHIATTFGRNAWLTAHCVKFRQNEEDNLLLLLSDVTQRKQAEAAEREQRTLAEALRDTAEMLNSSLEYGEVLDHILVAAGKVVSHDAASILLIDQGIARVARLQGYAEQGLDAEIAKLELSVTETVNLKQMLETRQPLVIPDTHSFPGWQILPATEWVHSNIGAPITISREVVGFILLDSGATNFFTPIHAERLKAFANQAAIAIQNARLLQQAKEEIAERKQAEEELRQSESRYRTVVENQTEFIVRWKANGMRTFVNDAYCRYYGLTIGEALTSDFLSLVHSADRPAIEKKISRLLAGTIHAETDIHRVIKPDGSIGWQEWTDSAIYDKDGHVIEFQSIGRDITERKQAEEELRTSEERFRQLASNIQEVFWMTDAVTGEEIYISPASEQIWGRSIESMLRDPQAFVNSILPEDRPHVLEQIREQRNGSKTDMEYRIVRPDGSVSWVWDRAFPIFDESGKVVRLAGIAADITERKQVQEKLRESENRYRGLFENLVIGFALHEIVTDEHGKPIDYIFLEINPMFEQLTGIRAREAIGRRVSEVLPQVENERFIAIYGKVALTGQPVHLEEFSNDLNKYYEINAYSPKHGQFAVTFLDITERKQAEEQLRKLSRAVEQSTSTIVITDLMGNIEYANPKFTETTGYSIKEAIGQNLRILKSEYTTPEEYEHMWQTIKAGEEWRGEFLNKKKNGELCWESATISPIFNDRRQITHFIAIKEDITERKRSEQETSRHLAEMEALYENGLAVGQLLNPRGIGERIIETFAHHLSWHHVAIRLLQPGSDTLELIAFNQPGLSDEERYDIENRFQSMISKVGRGLSGWVVQIGEPLRTGDVHAHVQYVDTHIGIQSGLYMPLKVGDRIIGVISVESEAPDAFTLQDERLLATLASQAAIAFENARLYQTNQQERERFSDLFENTPVATWLEDFTAVISWMDGLRIQGVRNLKAYLEAHPEQYTLCVSLIQILDVNHAAVVMNGAHNKEELIEKVYGLLVEETPSAIMIDELDLIWKGYTSFGFEMSSHKLDGSLVTGIQRIYIPSNNNEPDYSRVIVTSTDITDRMNVENQLRTSEVHYRELTDSITDIFFELDQDLRYTHWNKASEMLIGLSAEYAIGRSMQEVFGINEEQTRIEKIYKNILDTHQPRSFEATLSVNDQSRTFEFNAYPSTRGLAAVAKDVTERKLSESLMQKRFELMEYSASHELEELMQKALDEISEWTHSTIGFFQLIKEDQVTSSLQVWSTDTFKHFHSSQMEQMHKPADQAGLWAEAVRQRRAVIHNDFESLRGKKGLPEGHASVVRELVLPIIRNEKIMAVIGIGNKAQDYTRGDLEITERFADYAWDVIERKQMVIEIAEERNLLAKRVEERTSDLSRANSNLARALRVKDEFLANMSHELRTPLNAILGLSESLGEQTAGPLNEKQQKYLNTISESGHHLLSLINDILDLAKIEAGQISLDINKVDVNQVTQASLRMVRQLAQKKNLEISLEIDDKIGLMWADERRLKQMIVNLLSNAVKFTPEGGRLGLQVSGDQGENKVSFTVWDTGIGIKQSDFERLFQPFVQLDSGLARESSGTGLGLALVSQMARLHGGSISVNSEAGKGSRFTIVLPWEPALAPDVVERMKVTGKFLTIQPGQPQQTILLVEDTQEVVMMIKDYLEIAGYKVATAQDGLDGLTQAKFTHPDLILMDVQMPRMDGLEATKTLRLDPEFKYTPIIALTALAMPNDRERCIAAGMDEYISKPVNLRGLVKLIQNYLSLREEKTKPR